MLQEKESFPIRMGDTLILSSISTFDPSLGAIFLLILHSVAFDRSSFPSLGFYFFTYIMRKTFHNPNYFTLIMVQWKALPDCGPENLSLDIVLGYNPIYE